MEKISELAIIMIVIFFTFLYSNKRNEEAMKAANRRLKFGLIISTVVIVVPFWMLFLLMINCENISSSIGMSSRNITIVVFSVFFITTPTIFKRVYEPINKKKYEQDINYRKNNLKNWKYYILCKPATSLQISLKLPPASRWSKPNPKELKKYRKEKLDDPPSYIQFLLLLLTYIITTIGFWLFDYIKGSSDLIHLNLVVIPFVVIIILFGEMIFGIISFIERLVGRSFNEFLKYFLFNMLYILIIITFHSFIRR